MPSHTDPESESAHEPAAAAPRNARVGPAAASEAQTPTLGARALALALAAGLAAGLIAWAAGEWTMRSETGIGSHRGIAYVSNEVFAIRNGVNSFGILGAALGLALGLTGGQVGRSALRSALAALAGLVLGAAAGAGSARLLMPVYYNTERLNNIVYPLAVHAGIFGAVGAVGGLAFALGLGGRGRLVRGVIGGVVGALVATILFELVGGLIFPMDQVDRPLSITATTRLLARLLVALGVAAAVVIASQGRGRAPRDATSTGR